MTTEPELPLLSGPTPASAPNPPVLWRRWTDEPATPAATPVPSTIGSVLIACGMVVLSLLVLVGFGQILTGEAHPSWIVVIVSPFMAFLFAGIGIHGAVHIHRHFAQRDDGGEIETRFWRWWTDTVGFGLLKLIGSAVVAILGYVVLRGLFKALSTGTGLIIALLLGIFLALCQISARLR